ncbi:ATP-dependent Clp protease proteolytic subunit [Kocuria oceani]
MSTYTVPYVVERTPHGERSMDVFSRLLAERIVYLGTEIDDGVANVLIAQLLYLDSYGSEQPIGLYINSPGGSVPAMLAIYDAIQYVGAPVETTCVGQAANAAAVLLAAAALLLPFTERLATQIAVVSYCLPIVAVGPIIFIVVGPPRSGEPSGTAVTLAAISVFFTTYVSVLAGFRTAERSTLDVVTVAGGSRWDQLVKVRLVSALPGVFTALKIAAPAALLGAILGEYVGGVDRGMGPAMVNAQQSLEVARVWAVALVSGGLAFLAYALVGTVARFVTPWSSGGREVGR